MIYNFYIDSKTRKIKHEAMTVMRMDHNVHTIRFTVEDPEDFTFDGASILIKAVLPNKEKVEITPENIVIEDIVEIEDEVERVTGHSASFDWTLKQSVTRHAGPVTYSICALQLALDGTTVSQEWHTVDDTFQIFDHKHFDGSDDQDDPDMQATNAEKIAALKNTVSSINTKVNGLASGAPPAADSTAEMDPGESTIYVNTTDGHLYFWNGTSWNQGGIYGANIVDPTVTKEGVAPDAAAVRRLINGVSEALEDKADSADIDGLDQRVTALEEGGSGSGITAAVKNALLALFRNVVYAGANGQALYDDLYDAFYDVTAIRLDNYSLVFTTTGDTAQITATTVPAGGTVTWESSDTSVATVDQTGLVTSVGYGSAVITATSGSASASCSITVSQVKLLSISANYTQSGRVYPSTALDSLKSDLVVTASWSDGTTSTVAGSNYVLSGTLTAGTRQVTVSYGGKTATFNVVVSPMYTVSNNLTHCTTNNDATSIGEGQAYRATITADEGYQLDTATITMGGTDVTATVYNAGVINIASVTGNIVITVTTSEDMTGVLHFVDFTQSLVDQITGDSVSAISNSKYTANAPTRDSNGLTFTDIAQFVTIAQVTVPCTIEVKTGAYNVPSISNINSRFIMMGTAFDTDNMQGYTSNGNGPLIYRGGGGYGYWAAYNGSWGTSYTRISNRADIANSTIKIYIDGDGLTHLYINGTSYGSAGTIKFDALPYLQLGSASDTSNLVGLTVESIKVYDGEV